jgi:galactokinase/mevalonate kinase-like predicted kinase
MTKTQKRTYEKAIFRGHYGGTLSAPGGVEGFLIVIKRVDFLGGVKRKMVKKCSSYSLRASVNFKEKSVNFVKKWLKNPVLVL